MKITFGISHCIGDAYNVEYTIPCPGNADIKAVSTIHFSKFKLNSLIYQAKNAIRSRMYVLAKRGVAIPPLENTTMIWDANTENLPTVLQKQSISSWHVNDEDKEPVEPVVTDEVPLLEIKKVSGVWTIVKHEEPLLTWEDACKVLKEKVDSNE